ncbi:uncharacterized protein N7498_009810 [Penicillium cinerascens]|uniref:Xylanolytic transcriptional activator regulatory domain-containing protein n=1 Tax=Penicillium cinerascens TaxID=70096 RepID=A0A9W9M690_9EURO|nr:uncharacterized protein N7498_009810 [Penicillium cinerascens]KAJ5190825.1 hypothetical protein N7498_009810 [Penicillium cinerascens]
MRWVPHLLQLCILRPTLLTVLRRIEDLEARLAAAIEGNASNAVHKPEQASGVSGNPLSRRSDMKKRRLGDGVRFLSLCHDEIGEPAYLGPSSGLSMAENVSRMVHNAIGMKLLPINESIQQPDGPLPNAVKSKIVPPDDATGTQILDAYFNNMHMRLPFLDRTEIFELHSKRYQITEVTPEAQFARFKLFMIYAIGATICQITETYDSTAPNDYLIAALEFDPTLRESISVASIEATMLLVLYNLRSNSNSSIWYMIGSAMRTCVDFGFHRESYYRRMDPHEADSRRRLFWSVYLMERYTASSLGRPFSIAEEEIDVELPPNIDDSMNSDDLIDRMFNYHSRGKPHKARLGRFIALIRLQRIVSRIHTRIYRVDKHISALRPEVGPLMSSLQEFKETLPPLDLQEGDFVHMHWHNSVRILIQPFLSILHPQDKLISTCLFASGQMCQFFKQMRQRDSSGYSFLLVNSIFMAGLTMCFCVFRSPGLWTPTISNDLRACSSALFVMAERNQKLKNYRDGLETIINRAMDFVQQASDAQKSNQGGIHTEEVTGFAQPSETTQSLEIQLHQPNAVDACGLDTEAFNFPDDDLFQHLRDLPFNLQDSLSRDNVDVLHSLDDIFSDDFWVADAFNTPTLDGFE